jgi:hypothetical protein
VVVQLQGRLLLLLLTTTTTTTMIQWIVLSLTEQTLYYRHTAMVVVLLVFPFLLQNYFFEKLLRSSPYVTFSLLNYFNVCFVSLLRAVTIMWLVASLVVIVSPLPTTS